MKMHVDTAYRSLFKYGEELCGDNVRITRTEDSVFAVLADGLGSGVKANILSTLTSTIISTMLTEGAAMEQAVETIVSTLPICSVRKLAYSTFSVLQIKDTGEAYLAEFDNPACIFIRNGELMELEMTDKEYAGKTVYESRFTVFPGDVLALISDGVVYAGVGSILNFGWTWESVAEWLRKESLKEKSAPRLAAALSQAVKELYMDKPGDDSTVMVARISPRQVVNMFAGPPKNKDDDPKMVRDFMTSSGKKLICGGSSANIVARVLNRSIETSLDYVDPLIPPIATIQGIDLVTEGVLTLSRTVEILQEYLDHETDSFYFKKLDEKNGAAMLAKILLEECTTLNLFIGTAINPAHQNPGLPSDLSIKLKLIDKLCGLMERLGKRVTKKYY
ncbi:MAG: SpoIIE family protein phosphatase [[Clostridium] leptum]|nr:SpoIIE family protein phosphatase [Clostridiaceae bacterium]MEE0678010.1 SpoIIE family protein phosphatase [[Clostridium] leptum]PEQ25490.1 serine/threonine protein phosphatase [[Clostridium] leptum DSM 753]RGU03675.1 serine/threonine-protein phosphatase [[Clostridium] leptum]